MSDERYCAFAQCDALAREGDLCVGHAWQKRRGKTLRPLRKPYGSKLERLRAAMADYYAQAEADGEAARRAFERFRRAMRDYIASEKRNDPRRKLAAVNVAR